MKHTPLLLLLFITICGTAQIPNSWTQKSNFGGTGRRSAVGFSIGSKGYIGTGENGTQINDIWEYDSNNNSWTQKANFLGGLRDNAVGFSISSKGYIGTGLVGGLRKNDFWEFDPLSNIWTLKAPFAGSARYGAVGFSIGTKGYLGTGIELGSYKNDFWEYDPQADTWTQKADYEGGVRSTAVGFSINSKGYIGTGSNGSANTNDFWEYNPITNIWNQKSNFGGLPRQGAVGFSIGSKGYIGTGENGSLLNDFWEFDPINDSWEQKTNFAGGPRWIAVGISIGNKGYIGTGHSPNIFYNDFYEYTPSPTSCLVAYYPFSGNAADSSGNNNNGTVHGATLTIDRFGNTNAAYHFNGIDNYIDCGNAASLNINNDITVCAWIKCSTLPSNKNIISKYDNPGWSLETQQGSDHINFNGNDGFAGNHSVLSSSLISNNQWRFIVGERKGSIWNVHVDGVLENQNDVGSMGSLSNSFNMMIGVQNNNMNSGTFWQGDIDDIRIYNCALSDSEISTLYTPAPSNCLVAYYPFTGNAGDSSGVGNNGTVYGAILTTDRFGNPNSAYSFNGVNNYIEAPNSNSLSMTGSVTISCWVYKPHFNNRDEACLIKEYFDPPNPTANYKFQISFNRDMLFYTSRGYSSGAFQDQNWVQYTGVNTPDSIKIFLNGVLQFSTANQTPSSFNNGLLVNNNLPLSIGRLPYIELSLPGNERMYFDGKIDDVRIYNCALTDSEITALYTPAPASCLVAYYPFNGNANDSSVYGNNGIVNGATLTNDRFGNANNAYHFNGNSDYIRSINPGPLGNQNRSISFWAKTTSVNLDGGYIISYGNDANPGEEFGLRLNRNCFGFTSDISFSALTLDYPNTSDSNWNHYCVVYDNSLGSTLVNLKYYINGQLIANSCNSSNPSGVSINTVQNNPITIGRWCNLSGINGNPLAFSGDIDDLRIYNCALSDSEVVSLYNYEANPDDGNACTDDVRDPDTGIITHIPINSSDNNLCTIDDCDPLTGVSHTPIIIEDGNVCTTDACDPATGSITHIPINTSSQNFNFANSIGGNGFEQGYGIAVDNNDNSIITGIFASTADFDPSVATYDLTSNGSNDAYIAKFNNAGGLIWAKSFGGPADDYSYNVAVATNGDIYATGYFNGTVDFDPGPNVFNLSSAGGQDIFVIKLDMNGNFIWAIKIGGGAIDGAGQIAIDSNGNIFIAGQFSGTVDFDPSGNVQNLVSIGVYSAYLAKYDFNGNYIWAKAIANGPTNVVSSVKIDPNNNILLCGWFQGTIDIDPNVGVYNLTSNGHEDIYFAKFDNNGNLFWAKSFGGLLLELVFKIKFDQIGNYYLTGIFDGTCDFDPSSSVNSLTSNGAHDGFIAKFDSSGNYIWAVGYGSSDEDQNYDISIDAAGNIYGIGFFHGTVDFDPGSGVTNLTSYGGYDICLTKYSSTGQLLSAKSIGGTSDDLGWNMELKNGSLYYVGHYQNTVDFNPEQQVFNLTSNGGFDAYLLKMSAENIDDGNACTIDGCDPASGVFHNPINTDDGNACTTDGCDTSTGIINHIANTNIINNDTTICAGNSIILTAAKLPENLQNGLVAYYPFNGNANDESGNGNNGTVNGATLTTDRFGNPNSSYSFNGISSKIITNANFSLGNQQKSFSLWVKYDNLFDRGWLISNNSCGPTSNGFGVFLEGGSGSVLFYGDGDDAFIPYGFNTTDYFHLVVTYKNDTIKSFVNGNLSNSTYHILNTATNGILFGQRFSNNMGGNCGNDNLDGFFSGKLDDIGIWNRALTESEIQQLYFGTSYSWSTGETTSGINVTPAQTTKYYLTATQSGHSCIDSVIVHVNPSYNINVNVAICQGGSFPLPWGGTINTDGNYNHVYSSVTGCDSIVTIHLIVHPLPIATITASGSTTLCNGDSVTLTASNASIYSWSNGATTQSITTNTTGNYSVTVTNASNCSATSPNKSVLAKACPVTLHLKVFIEGFYMGGDSMRAVINPIDFPDLCDFISVELHNSTSPYSIFFIVSGSLDTMGFIDLTFPSQVYNKTLYIVVKHRNSLATWSKNPVHFNTSNIYYDFTTASNKAYGNNLANLLDGNFAIFSGDVNQDGNINSIDFSEIESNIMLFNSGYVNEDLTGDWFIESSDFSLIENNLGRVSLHP